jgi:tetratricopeptide (TPR) repeat protein
VKLQIENSPVIPVAVSYGTRIVIAIIVVIGIAGGYWRATRDSGNPPAVRPAPATASPPDIVNAAELSARTNPTAENYLNLSLAYDRAGRHNDSITAARQALKLRPNYAEAWNNIAVGFGGLGLWDQAIQACDEALKLRPDFQLAKNNLAWLRSEKLQSEKAKGLVSK